MSTLKAKIGLCLLFLGMPSFAAADAATHVFKIVRATSGGSVAKHNNYCQVYATLTNRTVRAPSPLLISLKFRHPRTHSETAMQFNYPALRRGQSARTTDHVEGVSCQELRVRSVAAQCPEARDRCPGFNYIQILPNRAPSVNRQKVEAK
jgi:hypothetical protein